MAIDLRRKRSGILLVDELVDRNLDERGIAQLLVAVVNDRRERLGTRCAYSALPGGGSGANVSRMFSVSFIVMRPTRRAASSAACSRDSSTESAYARSAYTDASLLS